VIESSRAPTPGRENERIETRKGAHSMKWLILKEPIAAELGTPPDSIGHGRVKPAHRPVIDAINAEAREQFLAEYTVLWPYEFQLLDDDGAVYFEGKCGDIALAPTDEAFAPTDEAFAPLDWAKNDSGCTEMRYRKVGADKWETL
jgi:hypothetical protein